MVTYFPRSVDQTCSAIVVARAAWALVVVAAHHGLQLDQEQVGVASPGEAADDRPKSLSRLQTGEGGGIGARPGGTGRGTGSRGPNYGSVLPHKAKERA